VELQVKERICIAGFCQTSRDMTPYDDPSVTVIGLNRGAIFMPRADIWFDLHSPNIRGWPHRRPGNHLAWLKRFPGPVFLHEVDPEIPNSVRYPIEDVTADLGANIFRQSVKDGSRVDCGTRPYYDSSIAYELALAIHWRPKEIMLVGVDLNTASEYVWQRSGVSFYLGLAAGRGIDVVLPDNCPLLDGQLYGRGYLAEAGEHMSAEQLESRFTALKGQMEHTLAELHRMEGAHAALKDMLNQMIPGMDHEVMDQRRAKMEGQIQQLVAKAQSCEGSLNETLYWIHQTPDGMSADEARQQIEQKMADVQLNGYHRNGGEELSEGDMSAFAALDVPEPVFAN
jgi:hypothetical protein